MYQSISQRFRRKNSNDLIVTFLPVVVVLTLHSYLRNADLNPTLFRVLQITAIVLLAALLAAVNHFYFRSFCYTLIDGAGCPDDEDPASGSGASNAHPYRRRPVCLRYDDRHLAVCNAL